MIYHLVIYHLVIYLTIWLFGHISSFFRVLSVLGLFAIVLLHFEKELDENSDELDDRFPIKGSRFGGFRFHLLPCHICP